MNVRVIIYGSLLKPEGTNDLVKVVPEGATVQDVILACGYQPAHVRTILATLNGAQASHNAKPKDGDELVLSVMVGGG